MALLWASVVSFSFSLVVTPFLMFLLVVIFLASIGKSLGVRRLYVKLLLQIFEYGRQHIEVAKKDRHISRENSDDEDEEEEEVDSEEKKKERGQGDEVTVSADNYHILNKTPEKKMNGVVSTNLISREDLILAPDPVQNHKGNHKEETPNIIRRRSFETLKRDFHLSDLLDYIKAGVEAIIEDEVTHRFEAEELKSWNLLTRTNHYYEFVSWRLTVIWMAGFFVRYFFLLPLRVLICFIGICWMVVSTAVLGSLPNCRVKSWLTRRAYLMSFRILCRSLSGVLTFHNTQYRPRKCGVCVANHTSPIDVAILSSESQFALIGQRHGGFLGLLQRALARASPHIWFERSEVKDREAVARRLREHVSDPNNPPILIFPEGTCINNTSVMQFKKGSFEVGGVIYPVAIKYDPKFGDAFWNSSRFSMLHYLYMMMTSWAIVCDVWYLPPMYQQEGESAIDFANRVKGAIARQGGLVDLMWDGQLKRMKPKKEWKEKQQEEFSKRLKLE